MIRQKSQILWSVGSTVILLGIGPCSPLLSQHPIEQKVRVIQDANCPMRFPHVGYCARVEALDPPFVLGHAHSFRLFFWQARHVEEHVEGDVERHVEREDSIYSDPPGTIQVWMWMVMATESHGSSDVVLNPALDELQRPIPGVYDVTNVIFTMASRSSREWWEMRIRLWSDTGLQVDEAASHVGP